MLRPPGTAPPPPPPQDPRETQGWMGPRRSTVAWGRSPEDLIHDPVASVLYI